MIGVGEGARSGQVPVVTLRSLQSNIDTLPAAAVLLTIGCNDMGPVAMHTSMELNPLAAAAQQAAADSSQVMRYRTSNPAQVLWASSTANLDTSNSRCSADGLNQPVGSGPSQAQPTAFIKRLRAYYSRLSSTGQYSGLMTAPEDTLNNICSGASSKSAAALLNANSASDIQFLAAHDAHDGDEAVTGRTAEHHSSGSHSEPLQTLPAAGSSPSQQPQQAVARQAADTTTTASQSGSQEAPAKPLRMVPSLQSLTDAASHISMQQQVQQVNSSSIDPICMNTPARGLLGVADLDECKEVLTRQIRANPDLMLVLEEMAG